MENKFENELIKKIKKINGISDINIVFLCIGTDKITGDCLGPLVGYNINKILKKNKIKNIHVIGTLEEPLCYENYEEKIRKYRYNEKCLKIAIDAAISKREEIGKIKILEEGIIIRNSLESGKRINSNLTIKGIVAKDYENAQLNFISLQNVKLNTVIKISEELTDGIESIIKKKIL